MNEYISLDDLKLYKKITSGKRLVATFLGALLSRRMDEIGLRYTS